MCRSTISQYIRKIEKLQRTQNVQNNQGNVSTAKKWESYVNKLFKAPSMVADS